MVTEMIVHKCQKCSGSNIVKNGHNASGSQQFRCRDCGKRGVLKPRQGYSEEQKAQILAAYYERPSMRGIERIFGVSRHTLAAWLEKRPHQPSDKGNIAASTARRHSGSRRNVVICTPKGQ